MSVLEIVNKADGQSGLNIEFPTGWQSFESLVTNAMTVCGCVVTNMSIKDGVLYVEGSGTYADLFTRIMRTVMMDSAKTCMVCGMRGLRRKDERGMPPLCVPHYLELINDEERNV